jgi:hypothetical protein
VRFWVAPVGARDGRAEPEFRVAGAAGYPDGEEQRVRGLDGPAPLPVRVGVDVAGGLELPDGVRSIPTPG